MLQPISHAWHLVEHGELSAAERVFQAHLSQRADSVDALHGLGRVALLRGQLQEAEALAQRGLSIDSDADLQLLMGEVLGAQGRRREAEQYLAQAVAFRSSDSFAKALLAEQKIRQGRWDEGTNDFIDALGDDVDGDGFRHAQKVISDLIDAYNAGRIPEQAAMKFINRLDYSVPKTGPEMQSFFAEARRAVNSGKSLTLGHRAEAALPASVRREARAAAEGSGPAPRRSSGPPARRPSQQARQPSAPPRSGASRSGSTRSQSPSSSSSSRGQRTATQNRQSAQTKSRIDAKQQDLQALIQHERSLNRSLVAGIAEMGPQLWPSESGYDSIDDVPAISLDRGSVLGESIGIDTRDFRITSGDLLGEIFLERCLRQLLVTTQKDKTTAIVLRPESIWQMELNCRDGLLQDVSPPSATYKDRPDYDNFRELALGAFIGECLVKTYDGTWTFNTPASESYLEIGSQILEPFKLAARWIAAADKDDVHLSALAKQAERASEESTALTLSVDYIDPTGELPDEALAANLAEMWTFYRFSLADTAFSRVAETIEMISVDETLILFEIGSQWVPQFARGPQGSALLDDESVAMAYVRDSGDFVPLASREGFARLMEASSDGLDKETASRALDWLVRYHRPGWWVASGDDEAAKLSKRVGASLNSPQVRHNGSAATMVIDAVSSDGPIRWQLSFDPQQLMQWQLEIEQLS